jgi:glucokinase
MNDGMNDQQLPLVVGVDLGGTQMRAAVLRGSTLLSRVGLLTGEQRGPQQVIPRLFDALQLALDEANVQLEQIAGIGIAAPGPLDYKTGIVYDPPNMPGWSGIPLRDIFVERFHVPVFVENDANTAGLGEYMFGAGRGCSDMVYLTISTGIGGGVIIGGKLLEGASGTAAELGHITIDWHGERCNCGNIGCLEAMASGTAIARKANAAINMGKADDLAQFARNLIPQNGASDSHESTDYMKKTGEIGMPPTVTARVVALAAEAGVASAQAIIHEAAEALGVGLVSIIHSFNPERIILGGGVTQMGPLLMEPVLQIVQERTMKVPREAVHILLAELGPNVGLVGAGALIYYYGGNG